jgi:glucose-6-phosphate 1-epimerase
MQFSSSFGQVYTTENQQVNLLKVEHQHATATISLLGGQLLSWQPKGQPTGVLWLSNTAQFVEGKAIRGGVPICWPWFGLRDNAPSHGIVRQNYWQLANVNMTAEMAEITLVFQCDKTQPYYPFDVKLTQVIQIGLSLNQQLVIENQANKSVDFSGALHTYFAVSDAQHITVKGISQLPFFDKLATQPQLQAPDNNMVTQGPIDRIYYLSDKPIQPTIKATAEIIDPQWQRRLVINQQGGGQWVVWNPGQAAQKIDDIHPKGEQQFICVEVANTNNVTVAPNSSWIMQQQVSVLPL